MASPGRSRSAGGEGSLRMARRPVLPGSVSPRHQKILLAMHHVAGGTTRPCRYEDIVVRAYELFPEDFQLRGYPQFPDSSDIHKRLYDTLKRSGLVRSANKTFALTPRGLEIATQMLSSGPQTTVANNAAVQRMRRDQAAEIARIRKSTVWALFAEGKQEKILDTDFYSYLGVTVRTPRNDFIGRLTTVEQAVKALGMEADDAFAGHLRELHLFLCRRFEKVIASITGGNR